MSAPAPAQASIRGLPVPGRFVRASADDGRVVEVDIASAWTAMGLAGGDEVDVCVCFGG